MLDEWSRNSEGFAYVLKRAGRIDPFLHEVEEEAQFH